MTAELTHKAKGSLVVDSMGDVAGNKIKVSKCKYNRDGKELCHEPILDSIEVTNSIFFAPPENGNTMVFADSPSKRFVRTSMSWKLATFLGNDSCTR
jgi:sugar lactone lactonase YvrE